MHRGGVGIARAEWTRHRREFGSPLSGRPILLVVHVAVGLGLGWLAHSFGRTVASGRTPSSDVLGVLASLAFGWMVWRSSRYTHVRFERLNPDLLLTSVPARTATLGLLGFVYARVLATLAVPTLGLVAGAAIGLRSPTIAVTIVVAVAAMATLAVALGVTGRLAGRLVALRLVRVRFYRDLLFVFGWIPLVAGAIILQELSISISPILAVFGVLPLAWFVDLALVGGVALPFVSVSHALGALGLLVAAIPLLVAGSTVLVCRIWESEPVDSVGSTGASASRSLLEAGIVERFVGDRIPRAVYTVARGRWLMERRVPRGPLSTGYVLVFAGFVGFPAVALGGGGPNGLLLLFAISLGMAAGIAFASDPIGTEYRTLPMLFTTVDGRQFVGGLVLAATVVGTPLVTLVVVPLGLGSLVGSVQTVAIALVGVAVSACTASVALAVFLAVDRYEYATVPFFFTDVPTYAEVGASAFLRLGAVLVVVTLACTPAFLGNAPPVYESVATLGVPAVAVQIGSLLGTLLLVAAVTRTAFGIAVQRYHDYQFG